MAYARWRNAKHWRRRIKKIRNSALRRIFDTRTGRRWLIEAIGARVLSMTIDAGDHKMSFSPADYIGKKVFRKGHFEREKVNRLLSILQERRLLGDNAVLLELGANIGTQTVYFGLSRVFNRIVSVEPDPRNFALLRTNVTQNMLSDHVLLLNCAAGKEEEKIDFFLNAANHGKSSAFRQASDDVVIKVPVRPVPKLLEEAGVTSDEVGLVWMDIEGYEPVACRSMTDLMAKRTPIYMEFTPLFYGPARTKDFIENLARFYEDCIVFLDEDSGQPTKVDRLPADIDQYDVLLLP